MIDRVAVAVLMVVGGGWWVVGCGAAVLLPMGRIFNHDYVRTV